MFDPDGLRHLAEILLRNAIQATPAGGKIVVRASVQGDELCWSFNDSARGSRPAKRPTCSILSTAAGRPDAASASASRAARLVDQAGGRLRWSSNPGQGSVFQVHLPLSSRNERARRDGGPHRVWYRRAGDQELGNGRTKDHLVGDIVTVNAQKRHVEGLHVVPVVPL